MAEILAGVDPDAVRVVRRLLGAGHEAYLVGGCVRDLYLGRRPKDFDVATSATPETIRRLFRNSRIIGRRFKLAHVFFGNKIIETSTFRTDPPSTDEDDLLIRHDNEWGSVEDDARRRDFTINGLFFDVDAAQIVDFVDGLTDLDARLVRTIGDPETRFREDPVRMIRAIKFAARLDFDFDTDTWNALLDVVPDIAKCSRARVLEEIYKLLRGGAAARTFELLLESGLMEAMMPEYATLFGDSVDDGAAALWAVAQRRSPEGASEAEPRDVASPRSPAELFFRYLDALDDYTLQTEQVAANGVLQAALFAPLLGDELTAGARHNLDRRIDGLMTPVGAALGVARRDRELARQILMAHRSMVSPPGKRRRRSSLAQRQYFHDALIFLGSAVQATGNGGSELDRWKLLAEARHAHGDGRSPGDTESGAERTTGRRRRGGRRRRKTGSDPEGAPGRSAAANDG
jgi:poly(A) polymerase